MKVVLVMFKADGTRRDFGVEKPRIVIGRTSSCDLRIPLSSVSRQHCEVSVDGDAIKLRDLGSSNGTFHNHIRVQEASLHAGDEIVIGPVVFTVTVDGNPATIQPKGGAAPEAVVESTPPAPKVKPPVEEQKPQPIAALDDEDDDEVLPMLVEEDQHSPTVDLDDPIAALEALADSEADDSGELPLLSDDDEDDEPRKRA